MLLGGHSQSTLSYLWGLCACAFGSLEWTARASWHVSCCFISVLSAGTHAADVETHMLQMLKDGPGELLRRLPVIALEDAVAHPTALPVLVWLMAAQVRWHRWPANKAGCPGRCALRDAGDWPSGSFGLLLG